MIAHKVETYNEDSMMEYSKPLMQRLFEKLDMNALRITMNDLKWEEVQSIPDDDTINQNNLVESDEFLMNLHEICVKRHITEGVMCCQNC